MIKHKYCTVEYGPLPKGTEIVIAIPRHKAWKHFPDALIVDAQKRKPFKVYWFDPGTVALVKEVSGSYHWKISSYVFDFMVNGYENCEPHEDGKESGDGTD
jgi:hypothetical protein